MLLVRAIAVVALLPACSLSARGYRSVASSECSSSRVASAVDVALAIGGAATAGYGLSRGRMDEPGRTSNGTFVGAGVLGVMAFATSAIAGFTWAAECRRGPRTEAAR